MKVLLHICCAPCATFTVRELRNNKCHVTGFWYNPNIHPYPEYQNRLASVQEYSKKVDLEVLYQDTYDLRAYFRSIRGNYFITEGKRSRCYGCYWLRMEETARRAREGKYDGFSTTILYSKFQKHDLVHAIGQKLSKKYKVKFVYHDFRLGWTEGLKISRELNLYRQQYCGCLFSEAERYLRSSRP